MIRATLDTNILVSALIVAVGKPAQIVARARQGEFALCLSEDIFKETDIALRRQHIQKRFHPMLNLKQHRGVKIITPNQFLKILESI